MKNNSNPLNTILLVILALIVADLFLNDGRTLAGIAANAGDTTAVTDTAVPTPNLNNFILPEPTAAQPATGRTTFTVTDGGDEPAVRDLVPIPPATTEPDQPPESVTNWSEELARPTATHRALTDEQLLACVRAQEDGRRMAPYCPTNAAELLGEGR